MSRRASGKRRLLASDEKNRGLGGVRSTALRYSSSGEEMREVGP